MTAFRSRDINHLVTIKCRLLYDNRKRTTQIYTTFTGHDGSMSSAYLGLICQDCMIDVSKTTCLFFLKFSITGLIIITARNIGIGLRHASTRSNGNRVLHFKPTLTAIIVAPTNAERPSIGRTYK